MSADPSARRGIPDATVARLPEYLRALTGLAERGITSVSSEELASAAGVRSAKLRKDLSHLGSYGVRGVGYEVDHLAYQISRELGLTQDWPVAIVGMGNLGHALAAYSGFATRGFRVVALLDQDAHLLGQEIAGITVQPMTVLAELVAEQGLAIGVIATPAASAQGVCDQLVAAGVRSILNFAPCVLVVPEDVDVRKVDLSTELQILAFHEQRKALAAEGALDVEPIERGADQPGGRPMSLVILGLSHHTAPLSAARGHDARRRGPPHAVGEPDPSRQPRRGDRGVHLQPHRGLRRVDDLPRRGHRHRRRADRGHRRRSRRAARAPLRPLRGPGHRARLHGRLRAGLDGGRRGPDPRPDAHRTARVAEGRARRAGPQHPLPAGPAGRQAGPHRDRHRRRQRLAGRGRTGPGRARAGPAGRSQGARRRRRWR